MIANFEKVKSLVESTIDYGGYITGMTESVELSGEYGPDMVNFVDVCMMECAVEANEFATGANALMIEAAMEQDRERMAILQEAALSGLKDRIVNAFKKAAAFFRALGTKIASFVTSHIGASNTWLKMYKQKVMDSTVQSYTVKMMPWNASSLKKMKDTFVATVKKSPFEGLKPGEGDWLLNSSDIKTAVRQRVMYKVEDKSDIDVFLRKEAGVLEGKRTVDIAKNKANLIDVIETAKDLGKAAVDASKDLAKQADDAAKAWNSWKGEADRDKEQTKSAGKIVSAISYTQKLFNQLCHSYNKMVTGAAKDCMIALNAIVTGKKKKED